ncbi:MAG: hypothetical protein H8D56_16675 [Planctomycetes bacterium]|nr:hypothetical protein [Planctomycetota bacterium]MBL7144985.1 hypothetical protein [Phycisphaerae bacterium]
MNENQTGPNSLLDTTDCLEAIGVFRGWKNFFFIIVLICLLLLQASFWVVNLGYIRGECPGMAGGVGQNVQDPNDAGAALAAGEKGLDVAGMEKSFFGVTFKHLAMGIRVVNAILIMGGVFYCLTILMAMKISLVGRLGGINHICRAFFLALLMLLLLLPWQRIFAGVGIGSIYTPCELVKWTSAGTGNIFDIVLLYLRFSGFWLLILLLLVCSQLRTGRWTKTILRRLEVI